MTLKWCLCTLFLLFNVHAVEEAAHAISNQASTQSLEIAAITSNDGELTADLVNRGSDAITGWVLATTQSTESGKPTTTLFVRDCYASLVRENGRPCLRPNETTSVMLGRLTATTNTVPTVSVLATVFDQGVFTGSPDAAKRILRPRAATRLAIDRLITSFRSALGVDSLISSSDTLGQALLAAPPDRREKALTAVNLESGQILAEAAASGVIRPDLVESIGRFASQLRDQPTSPNVSIEQFAELLQRAKVLLARHSPDGGAQ